MNECLLHGHLCFFSTIMNLIKSLITIRHIHLIINDNDIEQWMDETIWERLVDNNWRSEKIVLQLSKNIPDKEELIKKVPTIQTKLNCFRKNYKFQIKFF